MAQPLKPVAECMFLCDEVLRDPNSGKVSVLNVWETVRVPNDATFPYSLGKVCVFAWFREGQGQVRSHVEIVQASTGEVLRTTREYLLRFRARTASVFAVYRLEHCEFPEPGEYIVELYCEDEFVDDQVIRVLQA